MNVQYSKRAVKTLEKLDTRTKAQIREAVNKIPEGDIKPLKGSTGIFRLRVRDWRIVFTLPEPDIALIAKIAPRGQVYKE